MVRNQRNNPIAIGGVGGSGTRLIAAIVKSLGYYIGSDLNQANDNLWFTLFFVRRTLFPNLHNRAEIDECIRIFSSVLSGRETLSKVDLDFIDSLAVHDRTRLPAYWLQKRVDTFEKASRSTHNRVWAWKEPNTHIFMEQFLRSNPSLRYIHVMRNGLDMAYSRNQNQLFRWGAKLLGQDIAATPSASLKYWCAVHRRIQNLMQRFEDRIMLLNFDRLCLAPEQELPKLLNFLNTTCSLSQTVQLRTLIGRPSSMGRYRQYGLSGFETCDLQTLSEFGFTY